MNVSTTHTSISQTIVEKGRKQTKITKTKGKGRKKNQNPQYIV